VIAESYERIHRSNLIGMGVLPLQFGAGQTAESLGLTGAETFDITGIDGALDSDTSASVRAVADDGTVTEFEAVVRLDTELEVEYYRNGGILQTVLRQLV
jgi:aconitate hydratase